MAIIGWILSFTGLFGGLALRQDMPVGGSAALSTMLLILAALACPPLWRSRPLGISRGQRVVAAMILLLSVPLMVLPST